MSPTAGSERLLLVLLHGYQDDPADLRSAVASLVDPERVELLTPTGPVRTADGPAWFAGAPGDDERPLATTLDELSDQIRRRGPGPVVVLGYSQGAAAALAFAFRADSRWRPSAVVTVAGWLTDEPSIDWDLAAGAGAGIRATLVHGTDDDVVALPQGRAAARALERAGVEVSWIEVETGHALDEQVLAPALAAALHAT